MQLAVFHVSFGYLMQHAVIQCSLRFFNAVCGYSMQPAVIYASFGFSMHLRLYNATCGFSCIIPNSFGYFMQHAVILCSLWFFNATCGFPSITRLFYATSAY
tara:strand:+ start:146 stop:451 length:306 start_codon:yes stop_codon:yes gene_type:complete